MTNHHLHLRALVFLGLSVLNVGCGPTITWDGEIEAVQMDGTWVFTYSESPPLSMAALMTGEAAVVDGCLQVHEGVVIWREEHLSTVEDIIGRINDGETVTVEVGGGGGPVDEGTIENIPEDARERCSLSAAWHSGDWEITILDGG